MPQLSVEIERILAPFADPATEIRQDDSDPEAILFELVRDGIPRQYRWCPTSHAFTCSREDRDPRQFSSLRSLLASDEFADLRGFADTQRRLLRPIMDDRHIEPVLEIEGEPAAEAALDAHLQPLPNKTKLLLLDGPAGIGKTRTLQRLVASRAAGYLQSRGRPVLLVSSRGRRLSSLPDALAKATQDYRAKFLGEHVPLLVREGLIDLAIDGFDELVDADGYQDAWFALRELLEQLDGHGVCVFAARDTFFDQQKFLDRLHTSARQQIHLTTAALQPIEPHQARSWLLSQAGWSEEALRESQLAEVLQAGSYALRPFFLRRISDAPDPTKFRTSGSLRQHIISDLVTREAKIIAETADCDESAAREGFEILLREAAFDMVERESTEIDVNYLQVLCELAFEGLVPEETVRKLQKKAGSMAFFERTEGRRALVSFPHSEIQHHFVALGLLDRLSTGSIPFPLRRGLYGADFLEILIEVARSSGREQVREAIRNLDAALRRDFGGDRFTTNAGAMLLALLAIPGDDLPADFVDLVITEAVLRDTARRARVVGSSIYHLDARGADLREVEFSRTSVVVLRVDEGTILGRSLPEVSALREDREGGTEDLRAPEAIQGRLAAYQRGSDPSASDQLDFERYCDRVFRRALGQFWFRQGGNDEAGFDPLAHHHWDELEAILKDAERLRIDTNRETGGGYARLIHIQNPKGLLSPSTPEEHTIREQIRARAQRLAEAS